MKTTACARCLLAAPMAVLVILAGCPGETEEGFRQEYRMQVNVGPTTYWGMGAAKFAELVREKTGGRINVKPYYGSQLLKGAQLNSSQMVATGAIDCAFESTINTAPVIPEMNVFSLPFFIRTFERLDRLEHGATGELLFEKMREKELEPLAWGENGFRQLTNSRRPVRTPDDLRGLKIRVVGSPIFIDMFRTLRADPVNMNWGDAVTAFQQKIVDGQENPSQILLAVQIHQYHSHVTRWNYVIDPLVLYWNRRQFDAFPPDVQQAVREAARDAARYQKALARAGLDDGAAARILREEFGEEPPVPDPVAHLRANGAQVVTLTDAERDAFAEALGDVTATWTTTVGEDLVRQARADMESE